MGRHVCRTLRARGVSLRGSVRAPVDLPVDTVVTGDLSEQTDWTRAVEGMDAVIHLANRAHRPGDPDREAYLRINVGGTMSLARAAERAGVRRLVYLSSLKVHGDHSGARPLREDDPFAAAGDPYGESKRLAEEGLRTIPRLEKVVVRPPLVYGPGVRANFLALLRAIDRGWPLPLGAVHNHRSLVGVTNLVDALIVCTEDPRAAGETFFVADDEQLSTAGLVRALATALGRSARLVPIPVPLLRLAGAVTGRGAMIQRLVDSLAVDTSHVRERLGWRPPRTLAEGLAATVAWYRR